MKQASPAYPATGVAAHLDFERLFASLPGAYIIMTADDPAFTVVAENDAHAQQVFRDHFIVGLPIHKALPKTTSALYKAGRDQVVDSIHKVIKTGKPSDLPLLRYDIEDAAGKSIEKWWRLTHFPLLDEQGAVAFVGQRRLDVTDEVLAKNELLVSQSQLASALEAGRVSTWAWDVGRDLVQGDKGLAELYGLPAQQLQQGITPQLLGTAMHPDDQAAMTAAIQQSVDSGVPFEQERQILSPKWGRRWVIIRGRPEYDEQHKLISLLGVLLDITARKEAELKLVHVRNMFNALFESSILSIIMVDTEGTVHEANKKFLTTLGYSRRDLHSGLNTAHITPVYAQAKRLEMLQELFKNGALPPTERDFIGKNGKIIPMLVGAAMLPDSSNMFMTFMLDISENKVLKALNVAKDEFIALASHQLRTPATAVKQYLGILIDEFAGPVTPDQLQYLNIAYNSNERQLTIINDLLKTAQLDTKGYRLQLMRADVNRLIQEVVDYFSPLLEAKKQTLRFKPAKQPIEAKIDRTELKLALTNLVENASKYTPNGKTISLRAAHTAKWVSISIRDEGVGIAKADHEIIFEKFTRIDNPLSDTVTGTGLGLYWVKRIVDLHSGTLKVDSVVGEGTTFTIRLPWP